MRAKSDIQKVSIGAILLLLLLVFPGSRTGVPSSEVRPSARMSDSLILQDVHVEEIPVMVASSEHYVLEWIERELTGELDGGESETDLAVRLDLPKVYALSQNYPNPFNPSTTIAFVIPEYDGARESVNLTVYDIRGRRVRKLNDSVLGPGSYKIHWDGRNDNGESVSSGIYLYQLRAGGKTFTRKMTVLQ